jgi:HK97 family phage major capsid protein
MEMKTLQDLQKALEDRDAETVKKLAAIELKTGKVDEIEKGLKTTQAEMFDLMQRVMAGHAGGDGFGGNGRRGKSLGEQFVNSPGFKALAEMPEPNRKGHRADMIVKATLTSLTTDAAGSVGAGVVPATQPIDLLPRRRLTVRDLIPQIQITSGSVEVPVQKAFTNNAGMVAEGDEKPGSDTQLELKTFPARTIAHWEKASRQILDDIPQLKGMIDSDLIYGLKFKEEAQLLSGDNTGQNLNGMIPQATAYSAPIVLAGNTYTMDILGLAALQLANANYTADGIVMNNADWWEIRLMKDDEGAYIYGPPNVAVEPRLFGVPVVPTAAMTSRKFLVGEFQRAATIFDRWEARVEVGFVDDDFIRNLVTVLGEERLAFAVKRPAALVYGDLDTALAA